MTEKFNLNELSLGKSTDYQSEYAPELLQAVPRSLNREELGCVDTQPFFGVDVWHAYELSWLNSKGKPIVMLARCSLSCATPNIIESKSFKLYLNSFNQSTFTSAHDVHETLERDLSQVAGGDVEVELLSADDIDALAVIKLPGKCIDDLDISIDDYQLNPSLLKAASENEVLSETVHSHLLKSNCLITNQPDWASIVISYTGQRIDHESLLRYLVSFRIHNEFHEQCVERIYCDLWRTFELQELSVQALYTRRGGLDINPFRSSNSETKAPFMRINRQ